MITRERVLELLEYRPETGEFFWKKARGRAKAGALAGRLDEDGYRTVMLDGRWYRVNRLVVFVEDGFWPTMADHRDRDLSNNRRANLRPCTNSQNQQNAVGRVNRLSRFKGVARTSDGKKWQVYIKANGKHQYLGSFAEETEAARVYDAAARKHFGEFARTNFQETA